MCWSVEHCLKVGDAAVGARQGTERKWESGMSVLPETAAYSNVLPCRVGGDV